MDGGDARRASVYTPQAERNEGGEGGEGEEVEEEESPPCQPQQRQPVVTPTKGRSFVRGGAEDGPTFLDPFNSERAIEPTGPPGSLATVPTQER